MATITYLTTIEFGAGVVAGLGAQLAALGIARPLIVSDRGLERTGLVARIAALCPAGRAGLPRRAGEPDRVGVRSPRSPSIARRAATAWSRSAAARRSTSPRPWRCSPPIPAPLETYAAIFGGIPKITAAVAPVIAIPTTAGTGSEVGRAALITLDDGRKLGFISPHLIPKRAICDPELTLGLPPGLTAATGLDALSHCIETFLSPRFNPPAEAIALDGAGPHLAATSSGRCRRATISPRGPR